jgi:membrane protease subunit HflK
MAERNVTPKGRFSLNTKIIVIALIVVATLVVVFSGFYMVDQSEQAVILVFGKYSRITGPGLHAKLPFGIEKNYNIPTQAVQTMQFGFRTEQPGVRTVYSDKNFSEESTMLTGDLNIIDVEWIIQYKILDPKAWLFYVDDKDKTIRDISQSVINELVGDRAILDVIGSERIPIEVKAQEMMNGIFTSYGLGINIITVKLQNIVPPKGEVQDAFEDVNKAIQDMNRFINEGKEQYNKEIPKARGEANKMIEIATGYAAERVNMAKGDVARFNAVRDEYRKNRDVTRSRLYIEMVEEVFKNTEGTDLIDRNLDNFLPLKNLQSQGGTR